MSASSDDVLQISSITIQVGSLAEKYPAKLHARRVADALNVSDGLIYIKGTQSALWPDSDQPRTFRQSRYFFYITGVDEPDCVVTYDIRRDYLVLYIPFQDPARVIWNGQGLTIGECFDRYEVDDVRYAKEEQEDLQLYAQMAPSSMIYTLQNQCSLADFRKSQAGQLPLSEKPKTPDLTAAIDDCRVRKTAYEVRMITKANDISSAAHKAIMKSLSGFKNETEVEALFLDKCVSAGAKRQAYPPIAGSGVNASTLHYDSNDENLAGRQLICVDAGCEWECYASDITRTLPLTKKMSKEASAIYNLVLDMQTACIEKIKPGVVFRDLYVLSHELAIDGLLKLGILKGASAKELLRKGISRAFYPHGLGHHIGLECHDVIYTHRLQLAQEKGEDCLQPLAGRSHLVMTDEALDEGMVVTVEPGMFAMQNFYLPNPSYSKYIDEEVLEGYYAVGGVRIEDDILVTSHGYRNLTTAPKGAEMFRLMGCTFEE